MKVKNIVWKGLYYNSIEHCVVVVKEKNIDIRSAIIGHLNEVIYRVTYFIQTDANWNTTYFTVKSQINNVETEITGRRSEGGAWNINGNVRDDLAACTDIDISLSPFTNSLPINRLRPEPGKEHRIDVLYLNILERKVAGVGQKYTRLTETEYRYENIPKDFEAIIEVDHAGIVVNYPGLFERTMVVEEPRQQ